MTNDQLLQMLKRVREIAWIGYADGRTLDDHKAAFREIQVLTRDIGNEPPEKHKCSLCSEVGYHSCKVAEAHNAAL